MRKVNFKFWRNHQIKRDALGSLSGFCISVWCGY